MFADAPFRSLSRSLTHRWIRNQKSEPVSQVCNVTPPESESCVPDRLPILRNVAAEHTQPCAHSIQQGQR
jgi:hypothetical protein